MKERLAYVSKQRATEKERHSEQVRNLKSNLNVEKFSHIKYLKQDIKRKKLAMETKNAKITLLKQQMKNSDAASLVKEQQKHKRLIKSRKTKRKKVKTVTLEKYKKLLNENKEKDEIICSLETEKLELEEKLEEIQLIQAAERKTTIDEKTYNTQKRMMVYDSIVNQVPTQNIPSVIESHSRRTGQTMSRVPNRTTCENMARELDVIADLKAAEMVMKTPDLTIGFDATTQEGVHINSIHVTSKNECEVIDISELPGGTSDDYSEHICSSIDSLADTYSSFHKEDFQFCRSRLIDHISNSMSDRAAVNHATVEKVNSVWNKSINELNCHLHPLDSISTSCRSALKSVENARGQL